MGASPCSIGFAGHSADAQAHTQTLFVNGVLPTPTNVQNQITGTGTVGVDKYPLSRKLYFNTEAGWENVPAGNQLALAKCFADSGNTFFAASGTVGKMRSATDPVTNNTLFEVTNQGFFNTKGGVTSCEPACGADPAGTVCSGNPAPFPTTTVWP
jgi:hypothetical protein